MARILIHPETGRSWFVRDSSKDFSTHFGTIKAEDLEAKNGSRVVAAETNKEFFVFDADWSDAFRKLKRLPQAIPLKDIGLIIANTGVGPKSVVVDGGTGSGALACALGRLVKKVYTYEIKKECVAVAKENVKMLQLTNVTIMEKDLTKGIAEKNVDLVTLDLPEPHLVLPHAASALRVGGWLVSYSPQITQVQEFVEKLQEHKVFYFIKMLELIERPWRVEGRIVRPRSVPIAHSGFLTFVRKIGA